MEHLRHVVIIQLQISLAQPRIPDELLHAFKGLRPDGLVQALFLWVAGVTVGGAPLAPRRGGKLCRGQPLQGFHTGIVIVVVRGEATDPPLLKGLASGNEAIVIRGQGNAALLKKVLVHHKSVGIRADRKPVYAAILVHEIVEVRIIDGTGGVGGGKIHEAVFQGAGIMEGKPAAGDNIRQSSVFIQEPVEIQVIVPDYKFNIDIRKLLLDIGRVFFIELCAP